MPGSVSCSNLVSELDNVNKKPIKETYLPKLDSPFVITLITGFLSAFSPVSFCVMKAPDRKIITVTARWWEKRTDHYTQQRILIFKIIKSKLKPNLNGNKVALKSPNYSVTTRQQEKAKDCFSGVG